MSTESWKHPQNTFGERYNDALLIPSQWASYSFNNAIWLVLNDVILGSFAGAFLCDNSEVIGTSVHDLLKVCPFTT